jgi:hypothetical protein
MWATGWTLPKCVENGDGVGTSKKGDRTGHNCSCAVPSQHVAGGVPAVKPLKRSIARRS